MKLPPPRVSHGSVLLVWGLGLGIACAGLWKITRPVPPPPVRAPLPLPPTPPEYADPPPPPPFAGKPDSSEAAARANDFALALFRHVRSRLRNDLLSGAGVRSVLGMASLGARGTTRAEIIRVLGLPADDTAIIAESQGELGAFGAGSAKAAVTITSRVFVDETRPLAPRFLEGTKRGWDAPSHSLDFRADPDAARGFINAWVAERTAGTIPSLLGANDVTASTAFVLVNTVYFRAAWDAPFDKAKTTLAPFQAPHGAVRVPMMHRHVSSVYVREADVEIVSLGYEATGLALLVALPTDPAGLDRLVERLDDARLQQLVSRMGATIVDLSLPRFRFDTRPDVVAALKAQGLRTAFGPEADFAGMVSGGDAPEISTLVHQAFVAVDEEGTVAAAATAMGGWMGRAEPRYATMRCNRPFLFFIRHGSSGRLLFVGQVMDPSAPAGG